MTWLSQFLWSTPPPIKYAKDQNLSSLVKESTEAVSAFESSLTDTTFEQAQEKLERVALELLCRKTGQVIKARFNGDLENAPLKDRTGLSPEERAGLESAKKRLEQLKWSHVATISLNQKERETTLQKIEQRKILRAKWNIPNFIRYFVAVVTRVAREVLFGSTTGDQPKPLSKDEIKLQKMEATIQQSTEQDKRLSDLIPRIGYITQDLSLTEFQEHKETALETLVRSTEGPKVEQGPQEAEESLFQKTWETCQRVSSYLSTLLAAAPSEEYSDLSKESHTTSNTSNNTSKDAASSHPLGSPSPLGTSKLHISKSGPLPHTSSPTTLHETPYRSPRDDTSSSFGRAGKRSASPVIEQQRKIEGQIHRERRAKEKGNILKPLRELYGTDDAAINAALEASRWNYPPEYGRAKDGINAQSFHDPTQGIRGYSTRGNHRNASHPHSKRAPSLFRGKTTKTHPTYFQGIVNVGNTCYLNSLLQLLRITPACRDLLNDRVSDRALELVRSHIVGVLDNLDQGTLISFNTMQALARAIEKKFPNFNYGGQHDAPELWAAILSTLDDAHKKDSHTAWLDQRNQEVMFGANEKRSLPLERAEPWLQREMQKKGLRELKMTEQKNLQATVDVSNQKGRVALLSDIIKEKFQQQEEPFSFHIKEKLEELGIPIPAGKGTEAKHSTSEQADQQKKLYIKTGGNGAIIAGEGVEKFSITNLPQTITFTSSGKWWGGNASSPIIPDETITLNTAEAGQPIQVKRYRLKGVTIKLGSAKGGHYTCYAYNPKDHLYYPLNDSHRGEGHPYADMARKGDFSNNWSMAIYEEIPSK